MVDYEAIAARIVAEAEMKGAIAEAYLSRVRELSIDVNKQKVETLKMADDHGLGLRVISGNRVGFTFTSDLSKQALAEVVSQALANSEKTDADPYHQLPAVYQQYPHLNLLDPAIESTSVEDKIELAMETERQAHQYDSRIKITENCSYQDAIFDITLVNSRGVSLTYHGAYCGLYSYLVAVGDDGENQTGFGLQFGLKLAELDPAKVGREGAEKAVRMLKAKGIGTQRAAVVLDPYVATNFLSILAPTLTADAVQKGKSLFANRVGQQVAAAKISIIDDGTKPDGILSAPFDGEGVPTSKNILIDRGELKGYLYNTYTAAKDGVASTGNGVRGSFRSAPEVGTTNFYIAPGQVSRTELIAEIDQGLYITEVMGMHTANPISGDFSVGASGIWIEKGELRYPVRGVAIAGNILDLFKDIDCVGNDLTFFVGKGSPTLRISKMTISGS